MKRINLKIALERVLNIKEPLQIVLNLDFSKKTDMISLYHFIKWKNL